MKFWFFKGTKASGAMKAVAAPTKPQPVPQPTRVQEQMGLAAERAEVERRAAGEAARRQAEWEVQRELEQREYAQAQIIEAIAKNHVWWPGDPMPPSTLQPPRWWPKSWRW
jgi:hypothetical protein